MSLSDYIKYQRAVRGGLTPWEIAEGSGVPARDIHLIEVKHRRVGEDEEILQRIAEFFEVPVEELAGRREAYRKRLTAFLEDHQLNNASLTLKLEDGEEVTGVVEWFGREALALRPSDTEEDRPYIVQRGWIANWRSAEMLDWEVGGDSYSGT